MLNNVSMKLFASMGFAICAFVFLLLVLVMYMSKKKFKSFDSSVFIVMFILTFVILINEVLYVYAMYVELEKNTIFIPVKPICYAYILLSVIWFGCLIVYIWAKIKKNDLSKKIQKQKIIIITSLGVIATVLFIVLLFLGIDYPASNSNLYVFSGTGVYVLYTIAIVSLLVVALAMILGRNNIPNYQKYPIYFCLFILVVVNGLQLIFNYDFNVLSFLFSFVITTLYFTIESQDYKLINELEQKSRESEVASISKSKFLDNMSSEIRTPLNTIMGISGSILASQATSKEQAEKYSKVISNSIEELQQIINSILDISNIESGKLTIENKKYNMQNFVNELENIIKLKLVDSIIEFRTNISSNVIKNYIGDYEKILKIICYIVENVIESTEYGQVLLEISGKELTDKEYEIHYNITSLNNKVSDKIFSAMFNNFKDLNITPQDAINNTNLKLVIAKEYIDLLNGNFIKSNAPEGVNYEIIIKQTLG